ncbi:uncharacterized protein BXZ73DRAFT_100905 [Epithele typhae]|uniref:uncharacterized protein n=1 Tax=Epithele typhae TaxID=378194 RepID=UPI0020078E0B|nr:uncharacterized protein BXZ73DRAFT_100905 [Epithele typhae]KAH9934064.1 hypothetical protein BXZ73DRAFT_100905 [Epithele typhae]
MSHTEHTPVIILGFERSFIHENLFDPQKTEVGWWKWPPSNIKDHAISDSLYRLEAVSGVNTALLEELEAISTPVTLRMTKAEIFHHSHHPKSRERKRDGFAVARVIFDDTSSQEGKEVRRLGALCKIAWGKNSTSDVMKESEIYDKCHRLQGDVIAQKLRFFTREADGIDPTLCCLMLSPDGEPMKPFDDLRENGDKIEEGFMKNLVQDILKGLLKLHHAKVVFPRGLETCETLKTSETERYMIYDLADSEYHDRCDPLEMVPETIEMFQQTPADICSAFEQSIEHLGVMIPRNRHLLRLPSGLPQEHHNIDHYIPLELLLESDYKKAARSIIALIQQKDDKIPGDKDFREYVEQDACRLPEINETVAVPFASLDRKNLPESWKIGVAKMDIKVMDDEGKVIKVEEWKEDKEEDSSKDDCSKQE